MAAAHADPVWGRSGGVTAVALGSYARRELCPRSDVDLLLLHDGRGAGALEALVRAVCYPLWDAGLSVGHAVRTPKEAVRAAADRVDTATALLERRLVAGDGGLLDGLGARVRPWARRSAARLVTDLDVALRERHRLHGGAPGVLEPDLKDGVGALRDLHSLSWAGTCILGEHGLDPLVGARYLGADDRRELAAASDALLRVRCGLHLASGRRGAGGGADVLRMELQDEVADLLGADSADALLRDVGLAARTVAHLHARTWPRLVADARGGRRRRHGGLDDAGDGLVVDDGLIELSASAPTVDEDPALPVRAIAAAAARGTTLGRAAAAALRRDLARRGSLRWTASSRTALLDVLAAGHRGLPALGDADHVGLLPALLPEWERVRGRRQRNPLHTYDLDTHGAQAAAWLVDIGGGALVHEHREVWRRTARERPALLLGTWLHDVGKAWPGDHARSGEAVARGWVADMGFEGAVADRVGQLVRHHLLLPDTATQRDVDDPDVVLDVAGRIADPALLDELYLLSLADSRATGPAAWSAWKDLLVGTLHARVRAVLVGHGPRSRARPSVDALVAAATRATGVDAGAIRHVLRGTPRRYLLAAGPDQLAAHARLLRSVHPQAAAADIRPGPVDGTVVVSLVAPDRRGLLADCAGALVGRRLSVLDARVATRSDGLALDWFTCAPPADGFDPATVEAALTAAARGEVDVAAVVDRTERRRDARPPRTAEPVALRLRVDAESELLRVEVRAPDAPGILYRVTRALADSGVDVVGAQVATLGPEVRDTFFLVPPLPIPEGELVVRLRAILDG